MNTMKCMYVNYPGLSVRLLDMHKILLKDLGKLLHLKFHLLQYLRIL